jgi:hypothetical protein
MLCWYMFMRLTRGILMDSLNQIEEEVKGNATPPLQLMLNFPAEDWMVYL